jgi:hypothetical protein
VPETRSVKLLRQFVFLLWGIRPPGSSVEAPRVIYD